MFKFASLSLAVLAAFGACSTSAQAQSSVLAAVLRNDTRITISYQVKLGNGAWKTQTLRPGQSLYYHLPYPWGVGKTVYLRHDNRMGDGRVTFTNTTIVMHGCRRPADGWLQRFTLVNDGRTLVVAR